MGNTIYYPNGNTSSSSGGAASNNTSTSYLTLLTNMLQTGLSLSNGDGTYCCPDCTEGTNQVYFIASIPKAIQILNSLGYQQGDKLDCCLNISSSTSTSAYQYFNSLYTYDCCPNNFTACVNELTSKLGAACCNELQQLGIVEYGTLELTDTSPLCAILKNLLQVTPALTPEEICSVYKEILDQGIIITCDGCSSTIKKGPDFGTCYCYKITVPSTPGLIANVTVNCQGIPVTYNNLSAGDYYHCSELTPVVSNMAITFEQLSDCSLVPCTSPPPPCICYEFVVQAPQPAPIPVSLSCNGQLTTEYLNQGIYRFCSDSYPVVSPEVVINVLNDCESEPCVTPPLPDCACYSVNNPNVSGSCSYEYIDCNTNLVQFTTIAAGQTFYFCAAVNSVVGLLCALPLPLVITQESNTCTTCVAPPPPAPACICYYVELSDPNNEGLLAICSVGHTDCEGNPINTIITLNGYICSQTIPVVECRGISMTLTQILLGDCLNPAVGCPPTVLPPV